MRQLYAEVLAIKARFPGVSQECVGAILELLRNFSVSEGWMGDAER